MIRTEQIISETETHYATFLGKWQKVLIKHMMHVMADEFATYLLNNCNQTENGFNLKDMPGHVYTAEEIFEKFNEI